MTTHLTKKDITTQFSHNHSLLISALYIHCFKYIRKRHLFGQHNPTYLNGWRFSVERETSKSQNIGTISRSTSTQPLSLAKNKMTNNRLLVAITHIYRDDYRVSPTIKNSRHSPKYKTIRQNSIFTSYQTPCEIWGTQFHPRIFKAYRHSEHERDRSLLILYEILKNLKWTA